MKVNTSPVYIGVFLYRFAFLLIAVPVQTIIFEGISPDAAVYLYRADIFLILFLVVWSVLKYRSIRYCLKGGKFTEENGILIAQRNRVPQKNFDSLTLTQGLMFRLLRVCKASLTTARHNTTLYLSNQDGVKLEERFQNKVASAKKMSQSGFFSTLIFSVGFSGALTGLLSAIPFLRNTAGIIGEGQAEALVTGADLWVVFGYTALPPALRMLSTIFLIAWAIGALVEFQRHYNLRVSRCGYTMQIRRGLLTRRSTTVRTDAISAAVLSQGLLLSLLKLSTADVRIATEDRENKIPIISAKKLHQCESAISALRLPCVCEKSQILRPHRSSLWGYTWKAVIFLCVCSALCIGLDAYTPYSAEPHLALFTVLWGCVWFLFCAAAHRRSTLFVTDSGVIMRSFRGLTFIQAHIRADKIRAIKITQSIFQHRRNICNLRLYLRGRGRQSFIIKHIDKKKTAQLLKL